MKAVIFAGGAGTRLWPLSRRNSPKQFEKIVGDKSTLQLACERIEGLIDWKDLYISTNEKFASMVSSQLPQIPAGNIIGEPELRDVGPAVGLVAAILSKIDKNTPLVILWSDHIVKNVSVFKKILSSSEEVIKKDGNKIIFISQKPRFASQNLGWINFGKESFRKKGVVFHEFKSFLYRPPLKQAEEFIADGKYSWNLGYFIATPQFIWDMYKIHQPEMYGVLGKIRKAYGTKDFKDTLKKMYPSLPKISFDNAILEKIDKGDAYVVSEDLGWSDIGAWEALKEALQKSPDQNVVNGKTLLSDCEDCLVYNFTDQLLTAIDLKGLVVINTGDVVLICRKESVHKIKKLVENMASTNNSHLI